MDYIKLLIPKCIREIPIHVDYKGQELAENIYHVIIVLFSIVGFIWGYICQQFSQTVYIVFAGVILSSLVILPPWPMFRSKPLKWQKELPEVKDTPPETPTPNSSSKKKEKKKTK